MVDISVLNQQMITERGKIRNNQQTKTRSNPGMSTKMKTTDKIIELCYCLNKKAKSDRVNYQMYYSNKAINKGQ